MNVYLTAPTLFLAFLVQSSFLGSLGPTILRPDLLVLFIVSIGVIGGTGRAVAWGLAAGLLLDVAGAAPLGTNLIALFFVALLTAVRDTDLVEGKLTLTLALAFAGSVLYACVFLVILQATGSRVEWIASLGRIVLPGAVLNTMVLPGVYWITRRLALPHLVQSTTFIRR